MYYGSGSTYLGVKRPAGAGAFPLKYAKIRLGQPGQRRGQCIRKEPAQRPGKNFSGAVEQVLIMQLQVSGTQTSDYFIAAENVENTDEFWAVA